MKDKGQRILTYEKMNETYLAGIFLAVNAIRNAYILMDSPNCCYKKVKYINNHDLFCTMFDINGFHKIAHTNVDMNSIIHDRTKEIEKLLIRMANYKKCGVVFISSMPMANITGLQYDLIVREAEKNCKSVIIEVPHKFGGEDWLDGYDDTLFEIAKKIKLKRGAYKLDSIAIVGYLMDRGEGDHTGNINELKRIFNKLSLKLVSVWLDGSSFNDMRNIEEAKTIISLPYGRRAARLVSEKTGADLIELDLPLGIKNTKKWIMEIGKKLNRNKEAKQFIRKELKEVIPVIELTVEKITGKGFTLIADPYLSHALASSIGEIGGRIDSTIVYGRSKHMNKIKYCKPKIKSMLFEPLHDDLSEIGRRETIFIGNSIGMCFAKDMPYIQFGFPSVGYHCLFNNPFFGFRGFVSLINRIINVISNSSIDY